MKLPDPQSHDLRLPAWGPYTKKYIGLSHIADAQRGVRFDLSVVPGFYRRKIDVPNVMWESGYHPWESAPDFSYFAHRHELEWKDRVYSDISFSKVTDNSYLITSNYVNTTDEPQNMVLHYMASIHAPQFRSHGERLQEVQPELPEGAQWIDALSYEDLQYAVPRPSDNLVYDGQYRGEVRVQQFVGGSGIGAGFGTDAGDRVTYRLRVETGLRAPVWMVRYKGEQGERVSYRLEGLHSVLRIDLTGTGTEELASLRLPALEPGEYELTLVSEGGSAVLLDGFVLIEQDQVEQVCFIPVPWPFVPTLEPGPTTNSLLLNYGEEWYYGLLWKGEHVEVRELYSSELDRFIRHNVHDHVRSVLRGGDEEGHFTNIFLRPIELEPRSEAAIYGLVCTGTKQEVLQMLEEFDLSTDRCQALHAEASSRALAPIGTPGRLPV